jgi:arabinofuranosyltransferase
MSAPSNPSDRHMARLILAAALVLFATVIVRNAWVSDDAMITLRTVHRLLGGEGLTWNPGERVQAFTHPLWLFALVLPRALTGEEIVAPIALGAACSLAALWGVARMADRGDGFATVALAPAFLSRAFLDYTTSGLENPLAHALLALWLWQWWRHAEAPSRTRFFWLAATAALLLLNRLDHALLIAPAGIHAFWLGRRDAPRRLLLALAGALPLLLWSAFSLAYFGFPLPNTAYAKLGGGVDPAMLWRQGLVYLAESLVHDPVTLATVAFAGAVAAATRWRAGGIVLLGVALHLAYVVRIGGDFMSGRFLTAPFFVALLLVAAALREGRLAGHARWAPLAFAAILGAGTFHRTVMDVAPPLAQASAAHRTLGVEDERRFYAGEFGLRNIGRGRLFATMVRDSRKRIPHVRAASSIGQAGLRHYGATIIDRHALSDPLLARIPVAERAPWRPGHGRHVIPTGYMESVALGEDRFADRGLGELWRMLRTVTRGPLLAEGRFAAIRALNSGAHERLVDRARYALPDEAAWAYDAEAQSSLYADAAAFPGRFDEAWRPGLSGIEVPPGMALHVLWREPQKARLVRFAADPGGTYRIALRLGSETVYETTPAIRRWYTGGYADASIDVPEAVAARGFDRVVVTHGDAKELRAVGHCAAE